ncbi:MAG: hypothetical protein GOVbin703_27 [Prokaryotic dsDNA virus sp.]|mgnify:FL=1|nr:MAG: hypothetical protein GOVbin703_27 [Prokaryotic dsDNA virus sp.]|tara:strand:- start:6831 stop:7169 length:339 start_codon:yes stop_codon:yes gene_type:complete
MKEISYKNYSKISELKKMNKIDDQFVFYIESLTLEDLISIKLETVLKNLNFKFFNFPLWKSTHRIVSEALINSVINISKNNSEAARILGLDLKQYRNYLSEFGYKIKTWERK